MNSNFPKLKLKQYAKVQDRETSEAKYWKSFNQTKEDQLQSSPNCIHFNPVNSSSYIVTGSVKISLYDSVNDKVLRAYSRFSDDAFSGKFRKDGKLIVAGDKSSSVKVFDVQSKSMLREMKGHSSAVRVCNWASDGLRIFSGSDDKQALCWDLATEKILFRTKDNHSDYIRALDANYINPDIFATGSYDHTVKMWDVRQENPINSISLQNPVQYTMFTRSGTMLLTASGSEVHVYDLISGGKLLHTFNNHQKHVTSLCLDETSSRILSAGLDGHIKIYSLKTLQVVHGMKFSSPLVSLALSSDSKKLVIGFVNGTVMARNKRIDEANDSMNSTQQQQMNNLQQKRHFKGAGILTTTSSTVNTSSMNDGEIHTTVERFSRLAPYEKLLKKFNYQLALDSALKTRNPVIVITVLEELCRRSGLSIALSGRDESSLEAIIAFSARYVNHPKYSNLVIQVIHKILDLYANVIGHSDAIDELFLKLHKQVRSEVGFQRAILRVMGSLDGIISAATMPTSSS